MTTVECSTDPDPERRAEPEEISSVLMKGRWAFHAYKRSHDGAANVIFESHGFAVRFGKRQVRFHMMTPRNERQVYWHPDNRRCAYWALENKSKAIAVLDVRKITSDMEGGLPPHELVYEPELGHTPYGMEWSPSGKAIYVLERAHDEVGARYSRIVRAELGKKEVTQVARMGGVIDFFMPPVSRFENGAGPSSSRYWIVFGHPRGLFLVDPKGTQVRQVSKLPAMGLHNIEWHPKKDQFVLFFKSSAVGADGRKFTGVYLVHLDRIGRKERGESIEQLYAQKDVHTLWYSPKGKYVTWATADAIYYREPEAKPEETKKLTALVDGLELEVKGVTWNANETKLAFTAGNLVFVHDLKQKDPEKSTIQVASFGKDTTHFTAEPVWVGDKVYLTVFQDLHMPTKRGGTQFKRDGEDDEEEAGKSGGSKATPARSARRGKKS